MIKNMVVCVSVVLLCIADARGDGQFDSADIDDRNAATEFWYEDNNLARPAGIPADFRRKFEEPDTWQRSRHAMDVYMVRANTLLKEENKIDKAFIRETMAPVLKAADLPVALDAGGATHRGAGRKEGVLEQEIELVSTLRDAGIEVRSISLQSVLSKPLFDRQTRKKLPYPMERRYEDVIEYITAMQKRFPDLPIGIIDAMPTHNKDYRTAYAGLIKALNDQGLVLDHILLDIPFELPETGRRDNSWPKTKKVDTFVRGELKTSFGIICTSKTAGYESDKAYHDAVLKMFDRCREYKITPDYFVMMSWFPHPRRSIPDNATGDAYPALKTFLTAAEQHKTRPR